MFKRITFIIILPLIFGCASQHEPKTTVDTRAESTIRHQEDVDQKNAKSQQEVMLDSQTNEMYEESPLSVESGEEKVVKQKGLIFAKTDFQGVLKTSFVRLLLEDQANPNQKLQLHIGNKTDVGFLWDFKTVEPGHFFIELPEGKYRIVSISIPVGTTLAQEEMDVSFEVFPNQATYLGTLLVVGTKEKIKLGGVPVIKPGFEYTLK
ncbi:MAG: hypothetical protein KC713_10250, partial [Candidatus Omnitrophica bacterium]|nr:hypothetical protein [Candidatus Omnitrophota bacterium]